MDTIQTVNARLYTADEINQRRLRFLIDAIKRKARLQIRYKGHLRLVHPYRIWLHRDGRHFVELWQSGGGSGWAGVKGVDTEIFEFTPSPLGGWQGWINIEFEKIDSLESAGGVFKPSRDFNPNPKRRYGKIIAQISQ